MQKVEVGKENSLKDFVENRLKVLNISDSFRIQLQTPLRFRHKGKILEEFNFAEFFKRSSIRLKLLSENYGVAFDYDYLTLIEEARSVKTTSNKLWRHNSVRRSNSQDTSLNLDGLLGEIEFASENFELFLPYIIAGEFLHIGSACGLGLGKYKLK